MENKDMLKLQRDVTFTADDFDSNGNIKASSLMYAFQEIAAAHAQNLDLGFDDLMANNYIWVLSKLRFKVEGKLEAGKKYSLETYPRPKKGVTFFRDYYIYGEGNELKSAGTSHWCIINFETRRIERTKIDFDGVFIDHEPFEKGIEKFKVDQDALMKIGLHKVTEADLDENQHVNNCRYADMVENVLAGHTDFSIYFSKEALLDDEIILYKAEDEEYTYVEGKLEDGTIIFQAKVK